MQGSADPLYVPFSASLQEGYGSEGKMLQISLETNMHIEAWQVFWVAVAVQTAAPSPF